MNSVSCPDPKVDDPLVQQFLPGKGVDKKSGRLTAGKAVSVIFEPVWVNEGAVVKSLRDDPFRIFFYAPEIRPDLIHTYKYDPEANYTTYVPDEYPSDFSPEPVRIKRDGYIRIELQKRTAALLQERIGISGSQPRHYGSGEAASLTEQKLADKLKELREPGDTVMILLSDTHYGCGSIFEETAARIGSLAGKIRPDLLIHLGDLTDGNLSGEWTERYAKRVLNALERAWQPFCLVVGNHDYNYFQKNPDVFTKRRCEEMYLNGQPENRIIDLKEKKLRLIFLESYEPGNKFRYGFRKTTVLFLLKALLTVPPKHRTIVFSHVPPLPEIHYWDKNIRNSTTLICTLKWVQKIRGNVLAYIHGHNHADQVYRRRTFPIIGIGASKLEDFQDKKPNGSVTYLRNQYDESAILFDVLLVKKNELIFLRCGAGEDRTVHADI